MLLIHHKQVSLTRPVFNPLIIDSPPHAVRGGEGNETVWPVRTDL